MQKKGNKWLPWRKNRRRKLETKLKMTDLKEGDREGKGDIISQ